MNIGLSAEEKTFKFIPERLAEQLESRGMSPNKVFEYLAVFAVLSAIYYFYFVSGVPKNACPPEEAVTIPWLAFLMVKFLAFTAWPFTLAAAFDSNWRSKDAGNVFLAAYALSMALFLHKTGCGFCVFAAAFRAIPYVFCAWIAHGIGVAINCFRRKD